MSPPLFFGSVYLSVFLPCLLSCFLAFRFLRSLLHSLLLLHLLLSPGHGECGIWVSSCFGKIGGLGLEWLVGLLGEGLSRTRVFGGAGFW